MNKTKIITALSQIYFAESDKQAIEYKDIVSIKKRLRNLTKNDIDSIIYAYTELLEIYYLSAKQQLKSIYSYLLRNTVKEILKSDLDINFYGIEEIKYWSEVGIL